MIQDFFQITQKIGVSSQDEEEERFLKNTLTLISILIGIAGLIWGFMYLILGLVTTALFPFLYSFAVGLSLVYFHFKKRFFLLLYTELTLILLLPFAVQWSLGGINASGLVMIWGILSPMGAVLFLGVRGSISWFLAYIVLSLLFIYYDNLMTDNLKNLPLWVSSLFLAMNLTVCASITFLSILYYVDAKNKEEQKNIRLLTQAQTAEKELEQKNALLEKSLQEREILLKEIHHRVKNNMQVITSLLSLQSNYVSDVKIKALLRYSQYRIRSMAIIHEMLYQSKDLSRIEYGDYLKLLATHLISSMKGSENQIELQIEARDITLNIDTAIPLGLMINEIITNSLKYGIPGDQPGTISIRIQKNKTPNYILYIGDNGIGFPENVNFRESASLGILLMHNLALQLKGNIEKERREGTHYSVSFQEITQTS